MPQSINERLKLYACSLNWASNHYPSEYEQAQMVALCSPRLDQQYAISSRLLRPDGMNLVVTDLMADVVYAAYQPLPSNISPAMVLEIVAQTVREQVGLAQIDWAKILGLGVGVTGVIDSSTGICHQALHPGLARCADR